MVSVVSNPDGLRQLFSALTEHCFQMELGVADPAITNYLSDMLWRFCATDSLYSVRDPRGKRLGDLLSLLCEAQHREAGPRREIYRHIGDFTLFWSGLYPESIERVSANGGCDSLLNYFEQGKRSYHIASTYESDEYERESRVLRRLSAEFELCTVGLRMVRSEWEKLSVAEGRPQRRNDAA